MKKRPLGTHVKDPQTAHSIILQTSTTMTSFISRAVYYVGNSARAYRVHDIENRYQRNLLRDSTDHWGHVRLRSIIDGFFYPHQKLRMKSAEDKARFRSHFLKLAQGRLFAIDHFSFWSVFWEAPLLASDVFDIIQSNDIRSVRDSNKPNFITLVRLLCENIIATTSDFSSVRFPSKTSPTLSFLNNVRLLTRLLPFLYELPDYSSHIEPLLFYSSPFDPLQFVAQDRTLTLDIHSTPASTISCSKDVLALALVNSLVRSLFYRGFTLDHHHSSSSSHADPNTSNYLLCIWEPGLNLKGKPRSPNLVVEANRTEILYCILSLISAPMYDKRSTVVSDGSRFMTLLATACPRPELLTLVYSLINTSARAAQKSREPQGLALPDYSLKVTQRRLLHVSFAIQLVASIIAYPLPPSDNFSIFAKHHIYHDRKPVNIVRLHFARLTKEDELSFLVTFLTEILTDPMRIAGNMERAAFTMKRVQPSLWAIEAIMIMWELVQSNCTFRLHVAESCIDRLFVSLLFHVSAFSADPLYVNVSGLAAYFMLYLSADPILTPKLMAPMSPAEYDALPTSSHTTPRPVTTRDYVVSRIASLLITNASSGAIPLNYSKPLKVALIQTLYNLVVAKPLSGSKISTSTGSLKMDLRGGLSYGACHAITLLVSSFGSLFFLRERSIHSNLTALLVRAICTAVIKDYKSSRILLYSLLKNEKVYRQLWDTMVNMEQLYFDETETLVAYEQETSSVIVEEDENEVSTPNLSSQDSIADRHSILTSSQHEPDKSAVDTESQTFDSPDLDPFDLLHNSSETNSSQDHENWEEALMAKFPSGMTEKTRGKLPMKCSVSRQWGGNDALRIILTIIIPYLKLILEDVWSPVRGAVISSEHLVAVIEASNIEELILSNKGLICHDFLPTSPQPILQFEWSHLSLGWYLSLVYEQMYFAKNHVLAHTDGNTVIRNIASSIASVSKITSGWTSFMKTGITTASNESERWNSRIESSIANTSAWSDTYVSLFPLGDSKSDGLFTAFNKLHSFTLGSPTSTSSVNNSIHLHLVRRVSDLRVNSPRVNSGTFSHDLNDCERTPRPSTRNSMSSFHSLNSLNRSRTTTPRNSISM